MTKMTRTACLTFVILFILLISSHSAFPQIYRWTDEKGTIHFSDNPSSLPKDYSVQKKGDAEKKEAENEPSSPDGKSRPENKSIAPSGKPRLDTKATLSPEKPRPADTLGELPAQPAEPTKPTTEDKVIVQIKPSQENVAKPSPPEGTTPTQPSPKKFEPGKKPVSPPALPGDPFKRFKTKPTMTVGVIVGIIGLILLAASEIWFLVAAFKVSIWWGLACLFLAPAQLIFLFKHWKEARKPFAIGLLAMGVILAAIYLMVEDPLGSLSQYIQVVQKLITGR